MMLFWSKIRVRAELRWHKIRLHIRPYGWRATSDVSWCNIRRPVGVTRTSRIITSDISIHHYIAWKGQIWCGWAEAATRYCKRVHCVMGTRCLSSTFIKYATSLSSMQLCMLCSVYSMHMICLIRTFWSHWNPSNIPVNMSRCAWQTFSYLGSPVCCFCGYCSWSWARTCWGRPAGCSFIWICLTYWHITSCFWRSCQTCV
jgi:hypothetical protein